MQAIVLTAGEGQRLRPFTANKPKSMIKVANKPILEFIIESIKQSGIRDVVMVVGYKKERIMNYFGDGKEFGVRIKYAFQHQQLGTAHALKQAKELAEDEFLVVPGDNIIDSGTLERVEEPYTILYKRLLEVSKYGVLFLKNNHVERIVEKPEEQEGGLANTGIYCLDRRIFDEIGEETSLVAVINRLIEKGASFKAKEAEKWLDVVYPWDILKLNDLSMDFKGKRISGKVESGVTIIGDVIIGEGSVVRGNTYIYGPVIIGEQCRIGPNCVIFPSTSIGNSTTIGPLSYIENSVIGENVRIDSGCHIKNSVIDNGTAIQSGFKAISGESEMAICDEWHCVEAGAFIGEGTKIGAGVVTKPCATIGNFVKMADLKVVDGVIPDNSVVL
ncbi:nucleotidyl transferase [Archaeoglobales archaeon]|nr:MAG: nucleotidyl transferase [Archaeoglobales archaeon]